ncbi:MAG: SIS domain-containing protein [Verrucomicrobiaceae bacterium]|nr:SIS domain-containing protein [Verrucomicrobiaceae bacterium]
MRDYTNQITNYIQDLTDALNKLDKNEINAFINTLEDARLAQKQIFIMGNGGSASTASHFVCDFNKGASFGMENPRYKFICLNDSVSTLTAYSNDVAYEDAFVELLKNYFQEGDVVIGISGSGNSKNVLKAIEYANNNGGKTVGITGYNGGKLKQIAHQSVNANVDDMQISEDIHMILDHLCMKTICNSRKNG